MATLTRYDYTYVPGMESTPDSSVYTSVGTIPYTGTGGSAPQSSFISNGLGQNSYTGAIEQRNFYSAYGWGSGDVSGNYGPYVTGSVGNYYGVGQNPRYATDPDPRYTAPSPLTDPETSAAMYDKDTSLFGMLGSYFGPEIRRAMDTGFQEMYGGWTGKAVSSGMGAGSNVGVNAIIDWDLPNKQAEFGTIAWLRKVARDLTLPDPQATYDALFTMANRGGPKAKAAFESLTANVGIEQGGSYYNAPIKYITEQSTQYVDPDEAWNKMYKSAMKSQAASMTGGFTGGKVSHYVAEPTWNKENVNTFGGWATPSFGKYARLAPTSISQGHGLFSGGGVNIARGNRSGSYGGPLAGIGPSMYTGTGYAGRTQKARSYEEIMGAASARRSTRNSMGW